MTVLKEQLKKRTIYEHVLLPFIFGINLVLLLNIYWSLKSWRDGKGINITCA